MQLDDDKSGSADIGYSKSATLQLAQKLYLPHCICRSHVNASIKGRVVNVKSCHRINERIRSQAAKIATKCQKLSGRKRSDLLQQLYKMSVFNRECESIDDIESRVQNLEDGISQKDQEITELLQ